MWCGCAVVLLCVLARALHGVGATPNSGTDGLCNSSSVSIGSVTKQICINTPDTCETYMKKGSSGSATCLQYCAAHGMQCTAMYDDNNACGRGGKYKSCDETGGSTSDHICSCSPETGSWKLLFRQTAPTCLTTDQWKEHNKGQPADPNYSILSQLETYRGTNGKFRFKLLYPKLSGDNYQEWQQTSNPMAARGWPGGVDGYRLIKTPFSDWYWQGLRHGSRRHSLLDGSAQKCFQGSCARGYSNLWYYAIGTTASYSGGIPGPSTSAQVVQLVELYTYIAAATTTIGTIITATTTAVTTRYTHRGKGQCYPKAGPIPSGFNDINAAWSKAWLHYNDPRYNTEEDCRKLCDSKPVCAAYSFKQSYTDCQIYETQALSALDIVGVRERNKTIGHSDANCYTKDARMPPQHDASKCLQNDGQRLKFDANCRDCKDKKASGKGPVGCSDGYRLVVEKDPTKKGCRATLCYPPTCSDSAQNGDETDVDCGGSCTACAATTPATTTSSSTYIAGKPNGPVTCYFTADDAWDSVWYNDELIATGGKQTTHKTSACPQANWHGRARQAMTIWGEPSTTPPK